MWLCVFQLQTPASFAQSVQELTIALQRTGDPANLNRLRPHLELLADIDPSPGLSACSIHAIVSTAIMHKCLNLYGCFFFFFALIDAPAPTWEQLAKGLEAVRTVVHGLVDFIQNHSKKGGDQQQVGNQITKIKY